MKSDAQLETEIHSALNMCPFLRTDDLSIGVKDGVVSLNGQVHSLKEKWAAEEAVWSVIGVRGMAVHLDVTLLNIHEISDTELARHVVALIDMIQHAHPYSIEVKVESGEITLNGYVDWNYQIKHLLGLLKEMRGIKDIHCNLSIRSGMQAKNVKSKLEAAISRHLHLSSSTINIGVNDGQITLSGYVTSRAYREAIVDLAWAIPGVNRVENHLVIDPFITPHVPPMRHLN